MSFKRALLLWTGLALGWSPAQADTEAESSVSIIRVGHWLQVRGEYQSDGRFVARNIELVAPERYDELIGTIREFDPETGRFVLLGLPIEIQPKTTYGRLDRNALEGEHVKVEGYFRSEKEFTAREITQRGAGLDRVTGRVEHIRETELGTEIQVMNFRILVPNDMTVEHLGHAEDYPMSESRVLDIVDRGKDEDDLFGKGTRITDNLTVFGQVRTSVLVEDEYDLDQRDAEDVTEYLTAFKGRVVYSPSDNFFSVLELNYRRIWREDDLKGSIDIRNKQIGDAYLYWLDPAGAGVDFRIGRKDFDDEREWLYDRYLDGPTLIWMRDEMRVELSLTTTLSSGSPVDEEATNSMLYVSNRNEDKHMAVYVIHRNFDFPQSEKRTHYGIRVLGDWLPNQKSWLEASMMRGENGPTDSQGWGFDVGSTWEFHKHFALTGGFALGTGDKANSGTDETFRQTGLQDNNSKFEGVTSFKYYGEVVDPELANLKVLTMGLAWFPIRRVSLDLVGHRYWQDKLSREWTESKIDRNPNGRDSDLGWEVDAILGWRTSRVWDLEVIAGWFHPGDAFDRANNAYPADDALFGRVQFRYRF